MSKAPTRCTPNWKKQKTLTLNCPLSKLILLVSHGTKDLLNAPFGFFKNVCANIVWVLESPLVMGWFFNLIRCSKKPMNWLWHVIVILKNIVMILKESPKNMQFFVNSLVVSIGFLSFQNMERKLVGFLFLFLPLNQNTKNQRFFKIFSLKKMKEYCNF